MLGGRVRVGHNRSANLQPELLAVQHDGADDDAALHEPIHANGDDGAAVGPTPHRLHLFDDLHRPDLRTARDRPAREARAQEVRRTQARAQVPGDRAHQVPDVRESFQREHLGYGHASNAAYAAQVVPQQVDNHQVLGAVLLARQQFGGKFAIDARIRVPGPRPLDGPCFHASCFQPQEALGRGAQQLRFAEVEVGAVGRGRGLPQRRIERERVAVPFAFEAMREVHLVDVARLDVMEGALHGGEILRSRRPGNRRPRQPERSRGGAGPGQHAFDEVKLVLDGSLLTVVVVCHEPRLAGHVVERKHPSVDAKREVRESRLGHVDVGDRLEVAPQIVPKIANHPALERR